jgi:hypothetical protein
MVDDERKLWALIERKAFSPARGDIRSWLNAYHRFLPGLWGTDPDWSRPKRVGGRLRSDDPLPQTLEAVTVLRPHHTVPIAFSYDITENLSAFTVRLFWSGSYLSLEYDDRFLFEHVQADITGLDAAAVTSDELHRVLASGLLHPALHCHLGGPLELHEVRVGHCSRNPFVLLYQVALQLCDHKTRNSPRRRREIERLAAVVEAGLSNPSINPFVA